MPASTMMSLQHHLRRRGRQTLSSSAALSTFSGGGLSTSSASVRHFSSSRHQHQSSTLNLTHLQTYNIKQFSSLAEDWDGDDDDDDIYRGGGDGSSGGGGDGQPPSPLLPTTHSRNLPPPVCPPHQLKTEVESILDAPVGTLIVYSKSATRSGELKSAEEEMSDAYYASDAIVQRVEYIMRGLNACISDESFVSRSLKVGGMKYESGDDSDDIGIIGESEMGREDCFSAMIDLLERMTVEGSEYDELRTRVRSQLADPSSVSAANNDGSSSSDDSSSDSSSSDEEDGEKGELDAEEFNDAWTSQMEENMRKAGFKTSPSFNTYSNENGSDDEEEVSEETYQFGAEPGTTTHMYDLILDSLACLCQEQYEANKTGNASSFELGELMPEVSPPEFAKSLLDIVLNRHWMDGGDIGLGGGGTENPMNSIAQGIGVGAGTGAGGLAGVSPFDTNFDVRTCPTPMTFNAVIRVAANFDPAAYVDAVEQARILSGDMGNDTAGSSQSNNEQERLRDVTIDAALSTYSQMQTCSALTLRTLKASTKRATSRGALKRQAKLLADNYKKTNGMISGRNSATYTYLIQALGNCIPPSLSRGNMTFALYHKGCVEEGVMDERVISAMRAIGGYNDDQDSGSPPVSNGPLFDEYMLKELGGGVTPALEKGRALRYDKNYKLRRHVEWDDTY